MEKKKQCINQIRDALATENYNECTSIKLKNLQRMPSTGDKFFNELKLLFTMVFQLIPLFSTYYKLAIISRSAPTVKYKVLLCNAFLKLYCYVSEKSNQDIPDYFHCEHRQSFCTFLSFPS